MDVVLVMIDLLENNRRIMLGDFRQLDVKVGKNSLIKHRPPVFGADDDVIVALINTMRQSSDFHTVDCISNQKKTAGITPSHDLTVGDLSKVG